MTHITSSIIFKMLLNCKLFNFETFNLKLIELYLYKGFFSSFYIFKCAQLLLESIMKNEMGKK